MKKLFFICIACFVTVVLNFSLIHSFEGPNGFSLRNPMVFTEIRISDPLALIILGSLIIGIAKIGKKIFLKQE